MVRFYNLKGTGFEEVKEADWKFGGANALDRQIAMTRINDKVVVSTVFLGCDWRDPPMLFETMIFDAPDGNHYQWRRHSWGDALMTHDEAIKVARRLVFNEREGIK